MSPILGIWASQNYNRYSITGSFESIATATVGSGGSTSIDFTSISSTYTHLQLRYIARVTDNVNAFDINFIRFNSDTGSNYSYHYLTGTGSAVNVGAGTSQTSTWGGLWPYNGTTASTYGAGVIDILDYANTNKYKTIRVLSGADTNGSGECFINSGLWMSTSAITSINIKPVGTKTYSQYSHFALYGIRGN